MEKQVEEQVIDLPVLVGAEIETETKVGGSSTNIDNTAGGSAATTTSTSTTCTGRDGRKGNEFEFDSAIARELAHTNCYLEEACSQLKETHDMVLEGLNEILDAVTGSKKSKRSKKGNRKRKSRNRDSCTDSSSTSASDDSEASGSGDDSEERTKNRNKGRKKRRTMKERKDYEEEEEEIPKETLRSLDLLKSKRPDVVAMRRDLQKEGLLEEAAATHVIDIPDEDSEDEIKIEVKVKPKGKNGNSAQNSDGNKDDNKNQEEKIQTEEKK